MLRIPAVCGLTMAHRVFERFAASMPGGCWRECEPGIRVVCWSFVFSVMRVCVCVCVWRDIMVGRGTFEGAIINCVQCHYVMFDDILDQGRNGYLFVANVFHAMVSLP